MIFTVPSGHKYDISQDDYDWTVSRNSECHRYIVEKCTSSSTGQLYGKIKLHYKSDFYDIIFHFMLNNSLLRCDYQIPDLTQNRDDYEKLKRDFAYFGFDFDEAYSQYLKCELLEAQDNLNDQLQISWMKLKVKIVRLASDIVKSWHNCIYRRLEICISLSIETLPSGDKQLILKSDNPQISQVILSKNNDKGFEDLIEAVDVILKCADSPETVLQNAIKLYDISVKLTESQAFLKWRICYLRDIVDLELYRTKRQRKLYRAFKELESQRDALNDRIKFATSEMASFVIDLFSYSRVELDNGAQLIYIKGETGNDLPDKPLTVSLINIDTNSRIEFTFSKEENLSSNDTVNFIIGKYETGIRKVLYSAFTTIGTLSDFKGILDEYLKQNYSDLGRFKVDIAYSRFWTIEIKFS